VPLVHALQRPARHHAGTKPIVLPVDLIEPSPQLLCQGVQISDALGSRARPNLRRGPVSSPTSAGYSPSNSSCRYSLWSGGNIRGIRSRRASEQIKSFAAPLWADDAGGAVPRHPQPTTAGS
jgi:hypothetical protein